MVRSARCTDPELPREGSGAFQVLKDAIVAQQIRGVVRKDDPMRLAQFIWAVVHGISMLAIDGLLNRQQTDVDALVRFANERIADAVSA